MAKSRNSEYCLNPQVWILNIHLIRSWKNFVVELVNKLILIKLNHAGQVASYFFPTKAYWGFDKVAT